MKFAVEIKAVYKNSASPLKAIATVVFEDCFIIKNVKLIENKDSVFVSMPSFKGRDGNWRSICHPINTEFREKLEKAVIDAYNKC